MLSGLTGRPVHRADIATVAGARRREDDFFRTGDAPVLWLVPHSGRWPGGWVRFSCRLSPADERIDLVLRAESPGGWPRQIAQRMPPREAIGTGCPMQLPEETTSLRLELPTCPAHFRLSDIRLQELGKAQVVWDLLRRRLRHPGVLPAAARRAWAIFRHRGLAGLRQALYVSTKSTDDYGTWVALYDSFDPADREALARADAARRDAPRLTLIIPGRAGDAEQLRGTIDSVVEQVYPHWSLVIGDDGAVPALTRMLAERAAKEPRLRVVAQQHDTHGEGAPAEVEEGGYLGFIDAGDRLPPHALSSIASALAAVPDASIVYSDEDVLDAEGRRCRPWLKTDWNPDLMLEDDAIGRLALYRRADVERVGGLREELGTASEYDLALRVAAGCAPARIIHVPHVLYHRGAPPADDPGARQRAVSERLRALGATVELREGADGKPACEVRFPLPEPAPLVSVIIPTKDAVQLLRNCVSSVLEKTDYPAFDITVVNNRSMSRATLDYLQDMAGEGRIAVMDYDAQYNFSAINNLAASRVRGELLVFLNNDIEVISPGWMAEMVRLALRPDIGPVGAMLYYPDDTVQHAGVLLGQNGPADHAHKGLPRGSPGEHGLALRLQNRAAVTAACMMIRRDVFESVNGFDADNFAVAFNDVDLCLRLWERGYRTVWTPRAELYHHESATLGMPYRPERRDRTAREAEAFISRWEGYLRHDPFHNPNYARFGSGRDLAFPPPCPHHWRRHARVEGDTEDTDTTERDHLAQHR
jgi:GT2 family glycosyltransferase